MKWYERMDKVLCTQEAQVFVLSGDIDGYPKIPGRGLESFLVSWRRAINQQTVIVKWNLTSGLEVTPAQRLDSEGKPVFETKTAADGTEVEVPVLDEEDLIPADENPFATGGLETDWRKLDTYLHNAAKQVLVIFRDVDLLLGGQALDPQGRTAISYLRTWQSQTLQSVPRRDSWGELIRKDDEPLPHILVIISQDDLQIGPRASHIDLPLPTYDERLEFIHRLDNLTADSKDKVELADGLTLEELARISGALNLRQVEDVWYRAAEGGGRITRALVQERKDALIAAAYGGVMQVAYPQGGFERIIGFDALQKYFKEYVLPLLRQGSTNCPKGCVLAGPPGTGKTVFASALAAALEVPRVDVVPDRIKDKYVGESNKRIARLCEGIRALAPCVVFLDEIDKILPTGDDNTGVSQEILGQLQTFLSTIPRGQAFFVATTNYPERVPRALLRPGRFEEVVPMLAAHLDGKRHKLVEMMLEGYEHEGLDIPAIGKQARDYTGADVERLVIVAHRNATMSGRKVITQPDFAAALEALVPTTKYTQEMTTQAIAYCTDKSHIPESMRRRDEVPQENGRRAVSQPEFTDEAPRRRPSR